MVESTEPIAALLETDDPHEIVDILFEGWTDDYGAGRALLLRRLMAYRASAHWETREPLASLIYRTVISLGEDMGDMRWCHLAVECRDALIYGYAYIPE
jgi:hypothetical protein